MRGFLTNPVIIKELRERFRTGKTAWILGSYLFVMGAILFGVIYVETANKVYFRPGESREIFILLTVIQLGMIGFIAPALTAGTISGERERQTLNVLLTTHLTPFSIVSSKMLTSLLFISLVVLSSLPLYSFVFLYGGISPVQLIKIFWFFSVNIIFFGSLGVFCSARFRRTGVSTIISYGLTFLVGVGTALITFFLWQFFEMMEWKAVDSDLFPFLFSINPGFVLAEIIGEKVVPPSLTYFMEPWILFSILYLGLSVFLLGWATRVLNPLRKKRLG
ncbi:ABC transporter permease [Ammoniphilus resinae]|uniref:ABC-type transport system involved in multi-copper enzyme maturation permease subunit n=1 Tax=Ammoniphilus resinae TaxID=861532 RepID=A0ABS4GU60_9BACL|nr:ABC transporter permease [Ammoniphilus resinae]MBP1933794.1 ABC-type transport system involved in multi-copper enzyme maturation permease subunit [Ammoniphilus resinae]